MSKSKEVIVRHSLFLIPLPFLDEILEIGTHRTLMKTRGFNELDDMGDGQLVAKSVEVQRGHVYVHTTKKGTTSMEDDMFPGSSHTYNETDDIPNDQINASNIMFARGLLSILTGSSRRIKWI